ncbi:enoyl-CoA hydratase/isomerase family protein [Spirulina subsalsa FACHB-351]|uniref:Enoyl-CoA hydratase/isomerase family protein n=1 Tax=Spirulina subsalsa FACHB-351 TaxID=234711 RepID=A0ABT3L3I7_9CYAN|nr:crotonase/enoyl-CoA hydratase family protein [Spirulina subsalsa]MCW6036017.1 enoyl-CoA hydratase/isomerase family protein [Spirulina subsalsa FACHB-351]
MASPLKSPDPKLNTHHFGKQVWANLDYDLRCVWLHWYPTPRPCFNLDMLSSLKEYSLYIQKLHQNEINCASNNSFNYRVLLSEVPGVFNLGGDLERFIHWIRTKNESALLNYGRSCIEVLYANYINYDSSTIGIALIQGLCLGGGFEAALTHDIIVAEERSQFGFPEVLFNLFPGMGAYSFLSRRLGQRLAEDIIHSKKRYSALEMLELGIVNYVVKDGEGIQSVKDLIRQKERNHNSLAGLARTRRISQKLDFSELESVVEVWVKHALQLTDRDLRLMERLANKQMNY